MKKQSNIVVMLRLVTLIQPLLLPMIFAILLGVLGFLCAIFIPVFSSYALINASKLHVSAPLSVLFALIAVCAIMRGILHYGEQALNHYIAFKLLAILRDKVFRALRKLAPAKLDGKGKGELISLITSDMELLEVFYAHTISPIVIAFLTSLILVVMLYGYHHAFGIVAASGYLFVGVILPYITTMQGKKIGIVYREKFGKLTNYVLDSIRGLSIITQYDANKQRLGQLEKKNEELLGLQKQLKQVEGSSRAYSEMAVLGFSFLMLVVAVILYTRQEVSIVHVVLAVVTMMSSFGPVLALSSLANNLLFTLASARRILGILDETPVTEEIVNKVETDFGTIALENVSFAYEEETILNNVNEQFQPKQTIGILGKSGSGKSTLLKLIMRFYDPQRGDIYLHNSNLKNINTRNLRNMQSYVTQDTHLFHDTIENNIKIANRYATREMVEEACKKANIHDFIQTLPNGYDSEVGELGDTLSAGERQRISLARAFLHEAPCILLDEPTSNLDALNEAMILQSLQKQKDKLMVLVSHRKSTMNICDRVIEMHQERSS